jgi:hypothetical protein
MKHWMWAGLAVLIASSIGGVGRAQSEADRPEAGHGELRQACAADIKNLCADSVGEGHHVFQCIRQHQDQLSDGCKSALASAHANHQRRGGSWTGGASVGAPPPSGSPIAP